MRPAPLRPPDSLQEYPVSQIIVGFDGSEPSALALRWGFQEAASLGWDVRVIQSWHEPVLAGPMFLETWTEPNALLREVRETLDTDVAAVAADFPGVGHTTEISERRPAAALLGAVTPGDILVVGARGRGGFLGLKLGSVSTKVSRQAQVPVVVVKADHEPLGDGPVLVGVDGSDCSRAALRFAVDFASRHDRRLSVILAWSYLAPAGEHGIAQFQPDYDDAKAAETLAAIVDDVAGSETGVEIDQLAVLDLPARAILDRTEGASLVVVGASGTGGAGLFELGSVSQQVLGHSEAPVAIIRVET